MPLYQRLPKRGFNNINSKKYAVINLGILQKFIDNGKIDIKTTVTEKVMVDSGLVRRIWDGVRLLNKGEISSKVNLEVTGASRSAIASVEKNGGTVKVLKSATAD
jgi:large subunit ribosomal protein L15